MEFQAAGLNADKRVLYGLVSQVGAGAPVVTVFRNTIGPFTTSYLGTGSYYIQFAQVNANWPLWAAWQVYLMAGTIPGTNSCPLIYVGQNQSVPPATVWLQTRVLSSGAPADSQLTNASLAIHLYGKY